MNILLAADGSEYTTRMLAYLGAHPELLGDKCEFTVLTVVSPVPTNASRFIAKETIESYYAEQAEAVFKPLRQYAQQKSWPIKTRHEIGSAAEAIAKVANSGDFDMVVLGSHGHGALGQLVLGSVVTGVLARCKTPVLIVR